jgi:poly(3-hydroxybutyrate) depolymerase
MLFIPAAKIFAVNITGSIISFGVTRTFTIHAPGTTVAAGLPAMIVMHGDGGSGTGIQGYTGFDAVADASNFMAVYPDAAAGGWKRALGETQDVQFISDLIDYLCSTYFINKQKIYASGHSAGGYMTYNLATSLATKIAAFAPVAASMYGVAGYNYGAYFGTTNFIKVPIYHIHGDADGTVSYPDANNTADDWSEWPLFQFTYGSYGSCGTLTYNNTSIIVPGVNRLTFCSGTVGTDKPVYLIRIVGGGHGWPAVAGYNPAQSIWNFCNQFSISNTTSCAPVVTTSVNFTVNTITGNTPISNLIYGINGKPILAADKNTSFRLGGTRLNSYNWENNASHAGEDYFHQNDDYMCLSLGVANCTTPGATITKFVDQSKALGGYTLVTLPNLGYVSSDKNGTQVTVVETAPSARFVPTQNIKGAALSLVPNLTDNKVYVDEELNFIKNQYNTAANGGVNAYNLTNEAGIWASQTPRMHPANVTCAEVVGKSVDLAKTIKIVDQSAEVFGGSFYGFSENYDLQSSADWAAIKAANPSYKWYVDHYLKTFKDESVLANKRLLDVLSFHWYPEAQGDGRITDQNTYSTNDITARLQAPRSLWDPTYSTYTNTPPYANGENSWVLQNFGAGSWTGNNYFPLIPTVKNSINTFYPATKLGFGEYNYGGGNHITGGLTHADVLGVFGKQGVYYANYWETYGEINFISPAFRLYTNYDGNNGKYGNTNVSTTNSAIADASIYASINNTNDGTLHIIAINKKPNPAVANIAVTANSTYLQSEVWQLDASSTNITAKPNIPIAGNSFAYTMPAYSAIHFVLKQNPLPLNDLLLSGTVQNTKDATLNWQAGATCATLQLEQSTDGIYFYAIKDCDAATNTLIIPNAFTQSSNTYFRLVCTNLQGAKKYSNILQLGTKKDKSLKVFPVPAADILYVETKKTNGTITITDISGQVLWKQKNTKPLEQINIAALAAGTYFVQFVEDNVTQQARFVKVN